MTAVLDDSELVHLAVHSRRGPHVTPLVFQHQGGRLWLVAARDSVKTRSVAASPSVGALLRSGQSSVMCAGRARIVDPLTIRGLGLGGLRPGLLDLPFAMGGYVLRNLRPAAAVIRDRPVPTLPISRVLIVVDLTCVALLQGLVVLAAWGPWQQRDLLLRGTPRSGQAPPLGRVPLALRSILSEPSPGVLGWQTLSGPMAIPAHWEADGSRLATSARALILAGGPSRSGCCFVLDRGGRRSGPSKGLLLCGTGQARGTDGVARVTLAVRRTTYWTGTRTRTIAASGPADSPTLEAPPLAPAPGDPSVRESPSTAAPHRPASVPRPDLEKRQVVEEGAT